MIGVLLLMLVGVCMGQRSPYAPRPFVYPGPLPQYQTTTAPDSETNTLDNRFGEGETTTTTRGPSLPGSLAEQELIDRVSQWPKDKQPFWFINNQQLAGHRGYNQTTSSTTSEAPPQQRFATGDVPRGSGAVFDRAGGLTEGWISGGWRRPPQQPGSQGWINPSGRRNPGNTFRISD